MREFVINENDAGQRLDKYIAKRCPDMPKSLMYRLIRQKKIKVNRKRCEIAYKLEKDDQIQFFISDEFFKKKTFFVEKASELKGIVYEDKHLLIINKPPGVFSHSDHCHDSDTLIQRILRYLIDTRQYDPALENSFVPAIVNRLDVNTEGLIIACKDARALRAMNEAMRNRQIEKHYLCIIEGSVADGRYDHYYQKDKHMNKAIIFDHPVLGSVKVALSVTTLCQGRKTALLDIHLLTGKSHQIRAQMAFLGHPLVGDNKYGGKKIMKHQALCAYKLLFHMEDEFQYLNHKKIILKQNRILEQFQMIESVEFPLE